MQTLIESLGEGLTAVVGSFLFGIAILALVIVRMIGFGERERGATSALEG